MLFLLTASIKSSAISLICPHQYTIGIILVSAHFQLNQIVPLLLFDQPKNKEIQEVQPITCNIPPWGCFQGLSSISIVFHISLKSVKKMNSLQIPGHLRVMTFKCQHVDRMELKEYREQAPDNSDPHDWLSWQLPLNVALQLHSCIANFKNTLHTCYQ